MSLVKIAGLSVWDAYAEEGAPLAIAGEDDGGLSVAVYADDEGNLVGVTVHDGPEFRVGFGNFPASVL